MAAWHIAGSMPAQQQYDCPARYSCRPTSISMQQVHSRHTSSPVQQQTHSSLILASEEVGPLCMQHDILHGILHKGKGKEWGICPYRPPADQCLILRGHARRWNSRDPGLSVLYVSTEPVSSPLLLSRVDTKDRTRAPDGVKAMHPPPYR